MKETLAGEDSFSLVQVEEILAGEYRVSLVQVEDPLAGEDKVSLVQVEETLALYRVDYVGQELCGADDGEPGHVGKVLQGGDCGKLFNVRSEIYFHG